MAKLVTVFSALLDQDTYAGNISQSRWQRSLMWEVGRRAQRILIFKFFSKISIYMSSLLWLSIGLLYRTAGDWQGHLQWSRYIYDIVKFITDLRDKKSEQEGLIGVKGQVIS